MGTDNNSPYCIQRLNILLFSLSFLSFSSPAHSAVGLGVGLSPSRKGDGSE